MGVLVEVFDLVLGVGQLRGVDRIAWLDGMKVMVVAMVVVVAE